MTLTSPPRTAPPATSAGPLTSPETEAVPAATASSSRTRLIEARDVRAAVTVGREKLEILHGIDLDVREGEMVAVMGPSGSGKSTLLYCLAGLDRPSAGAVTLDGRDLGGLSRTDLARMRRGEVGFVFQSYNLVPTLSAAENVELPWILARQRPPRGAVSAALAAVGLAERASARPPSMSGGEQQRVALARVLAQQPRVIFADEPTGALDTATGERVLTELGAIARTPGRCVLVVTHDPRVAAACDRVLFLRDGSLVDELADPAVDEVAAVLSHLSAAPAATEG